ncbi:pirin family protein [Sporomusa termitida]|uniref:Pirin n=1 Tax=Sporomusa termitida TaxID=2377 RepID=A0A517DWS5_9FIRM|nr:pirin family protein [Sporomusa termitida]QDR81706.1 Pirin [Sporomusa termitida]
MSTINTVRTIRRLVAGTAQVDGAGVRLVRVIGRADTREFDPFLMLDAFDSRNPDDYIRGFPWHPHRGIETVTYLISGDIEHSDSLGNKGSILDGCCQWMTAGSGILHQEMPQASERMLGVQLWLNLPRRDKMTRPQYRDISAAMIPCVQEPGAVVRVIAGRYGRTTGATQGDYVKTLFLDVELEPGREWQLPTAREATLFIYLVAGAGYFAGDRHQVIGSHQAVLFDEGDRFVAHAAGQGVRFLLFAGQPLQEPVAWGGPIVMNTREELQQAFQEIEDGTFIGK